MGRISQERAVLISMVVEAVFYGVPFQIVADFLRSDDISGIFTILFGFTVWVIAFKRGTIVNTRLLLVSIAMFILATIVSEAIGSR